MSEETTTRKNVPDALQGAEDDLTAAEKSEGPLAENPMAALHRHLYGREEEIADLPLAEVLAELAAEGIDPAPLIAQVRAYLNESDGLDESHNRDGMTIRYPLHTQSRQIEMGPQSLTWRPKIFIGASRAGKRQAELLADLLSPIADCMPWIEMEDCGAARLSLDALDKSFEMFTHAVFILSPEDNQPIPEWGRTTSSDNLHLLVGLFVGKHGRHAVFLLTPDCDDAWAQSKLPSQLLGAKRYSYQVSASREGISTDYDLREAYSRILVALHESPRIEVARTGSAHKKFWDQLSSTIVIIFGGALLKKYGEWSKAKFTVSQHDLQAAMRVHAYLSVHYPQKNVLCLPTTNDGWQHLMQPNTDLILIGGFAANPEFRKRQSAYERRYKLRMGRLCRTEGQRVFHVAFDPSPEFPPPPRDRPEEIEEFPTRYISQDYGLVVSQVAKVYGGRRRVLSIAGIKGNGTLGAALALTSSENTAKNLDELLASPVMDDDTIETVVSVQATDDQIDCADFIEVMLNDATIYQEPRANPGSAWTPCELKRDCTGCTFGLLHRGTHRQTSFFRTSSPAPRIKALVFDLDDTLIDTFHTLITPLEAEAAEEMTRQGILDVAPDGLAAWLLELRRDDPAQLEARFSARYPEQAPKALALRRSIFEAARVDALTISAEAVHLLNDLRNRYELLLVTSGSPAFQNAKIDHLGIRPLFNDVRVLNCGTKAGSQGQKDDVIRELLRHDPTEMVVIGNRLDQEIQAGLRLGMKTIWLRQGEGAGMLPGDEAEHPHHILYHLADVTETLTKLEVTRLPSVVSIAHLAGRRARSDRSHEKLSRRN